MKASVKLVGSFTKTIKILSEADNKLNDESSAPALTSTIRLSIFPES